MMWRLWCDVRSWTDEGDFAFLCCIWLVVVLVYSCVGDDDDGSVGDNKDRWKASRMDLIRCVVWSGLCYVYFKKPPLIMQKYPLKSNQILA